MHSAFLFLTLSSLHNLWHSLLLTLHARRILLFFALPFGPLPFGPPSPLHLRWREGPKIGSFLSPPLVGSFLLTFLPFLLTFLQSKKGKKVSKKYASFIFLQSKKKPLCFYKAKQRVQTRAKKRQSRTKGEGPEGQSKKEAKPPPSFSPQSKIVFGEAGKDGGRRHNQRLWKESRKRWRTKGGRKGSALPAPPSPSFPALPLFCFAKKAPIKDWVLFIPSAPTGGVFFALQKRGWRSKFVRHFAFTKQSKGYKPEQKRGRTKGGRKGSALPAPPSPFHNQRLWKAKPEKMEDKGGKGPEGQSKKGKAEKAGGGGEKNKGR